MGHLLDIPRYRKLLCAAIRQSFFFWCTVPFPQPHTVCKMIMIYETGAVFIFFFKKTMELAELEEVPAAERWAADPRRPAPNGTESPPLQPEETLLLKPASVWCTATFRTDQMDVVRSHNTTTPSPKLMAILWPSIGHRKKNPRRFHSIPYAYGMRTVRVRYACGTRTVRVAIKFFILIFFSYTKTRLLLCFLWQTPLTLYVLYIEMN